MPRQDDETRERLEEPISVEEVEREIDDLPGGKTSGPDRARFIFL